jgi:copper transport protein
MSVWLGGLVVLVGVLLRLANGRELAAILPVWSSWALLAVITLAMTGTAQAIIEVRTLSALFTSTYGRLVLAKSVLLAVVVGVAWFARTLVARAAANEGEQAEPAAARLRRTVLVELAVTGVVLGLAATLVQTPPPSTASPAAKEPFSVTLSGDLYTLRADLDPARSGGNSLHLYAYDNAGAPKKILEWKATATPADGSAEPLTIALLPITDDHAVGEPIFPTAGRWELRFTLRTTEVDQATVSTTVTIT